MDIYLRPRAAARFLLFIAAGFILAHFAGQLADVFLGRNFGLFLFDPNLDLSISRFYTSFLLLLCSGLVLTIAIAKKEDDHHYYIYWLGLALVFLFLAVIKNTAIHESLAAVIRPALHMSKIQFYAWVYGILVVIFPALYLKFLFSLPRRTMILLVTGSVTFIAGAFGLDLLTAYLGKWLDHHSWPYMGLSALEEMLEMGGIVLIVYALLLYISSELKWVKMRISE